MNFDLMELIQPKIVKDGPFVIDLHEYDDISAYWIAVYAKNK